MGDYLRYYKTFQDLSILNKRCHKDELLIMHYISDEVLDIHKKA